MGFQENQGINVKMTTAGTAVAPVGGTTIVINSSGGGMAPTQMKTISISAPNSGGGTPTIIKQMQPKTIVTSTTGLPGEYLILQKRYMSYTTRKWPASFCRLVLMVL